MRRIYVASSWRNPIQPAVVDALRSAGHEVYDFRHPKEGDDGFSWRQISAVPRPWSAELLREVLAHEVAIASFGNDHGAMEWADTFVLALPAGKSAHLELGWATGKGKQAFVLMVEPDEPELMYREIYAAGGEICGSVEELVARLAGPAAAAGAIEALRTRIADLERLNQALSDELDAREDEESISDEVVYFGGPRG